MYRRRLETALPEVRERIAEAALRVGRDPSEVTIVVVTKGHRVDAVRAAVDLGLRDVGENRIGRIEEHSDHFPPGSIRWHMVGRLQSRKAPRVRPLVHLLHSVDSLRLAGRLEESGGEGERILPILVQVNTSGEESKAGFHPDDLVDALSRIAELPSLEVEGLMTMAPFTDDEGVLRSTFGRLRALHEMALERAPRYRGRHLSMGMSNDYELAVEEGSTIVRLGTVLLGERPE